MLMLSWLRLPLVCSLAPAAAAPLAPAIMLPARCIMPPSPIREIQKDSTGISIVSANAVAPIESNFLDSVAQEL